MPKPKRKRQATLYREGTPPTPEWLDKHEVERIEAPRIAGHDHGNVQTIRVTCRASRWWRDGWITNEQLKALRELSDLHERAVVALEHVGSGLDFSPRGSGGIPGGVPELVAIAMTKWERVVVELGRMMPNDWDKGVRLLSAPGNAEAVYRQMRLTTDKARCLAHRLALAAEEIF